MCKIIFTIDTGNPKPYEIRQIIPDTFNNRLDAYEISNRVYKIFPPSPASLTTKNFIKRVSSLKEMLQKNEAAVKSGFFSKPELHFIALIEYLDEAIDFAKQHPKTKITFR